MKKRIISLLLAMVMVLGLVALAGCGNSNTPGNENPGTSAPGNSNTPASEKPDEVYTLSVTITQPAESVAGKVTGEWCDIINERSGGRLNLEVYYSGTLLSVTDTATGVMDGFADIGFLPSNLGKDYFPITGNMLFWPFMGYPGTEQGYQNLQTIFAEFPEVAAEYEAVGLKFLGAYLMGRNDLYFAKEQNVQSPADLKGMKIGVSSAFFNDYLTALGAAPVFVTNADLYTSLDNGVVDGLIQHLALMKSTGTIDVIKGATFVGDGGMLRDLGIFIMNGDKFNSLPADLQEILVQGFQDMLDATIVADEASRNVFYGQLVENGAKLIEVSNEDAAAWAELVEGLHEAELAKLEAKCPNIRTIYDRIMELNGVK